MRATGGVPTAPLDDTFIHFQYAKQIAHGNWFRYFPTAPISTGATSFLYPIILAGGYIIGFTGLNLLWFDYILGFICLVATGYLIFNCGLYFKLKPWQALWIALLTISNGWLLWGYFSGMEIALQTFLTLATIMVAVKESNKGKLKWLPIWLVALTLIRPEGFIVSALIAFWIMYQHFLHRHHTTSKKISNWFFVFAPLIAFFAQLLFYRLATGQWGSNTFILKMWWYMISPTGFFDLEILNKILKLLIVIFYFLPKAFILVSNDIGLISFVGLGVMLVGVILARRAENPNARIPLTVIWIIIFITEFIALLNIYGVTEVTRRRYFIFLAPLSIFFILYAIIKISERYRKYFSIILLSIFTVLSFVNTLYFKRAFVLDNQNIFEMHYSITEWIQKNTSPNDIIAMNDAGVIPYLTDRTFFDVMGLVTNNVAQAVHKGPDAFLNYIKSLPLSERPTYFIIFPGWFDTTDNYDVYKVRAIFKILGSPIAHFTVSNQTIVPYSTMSVLKPRW